MAKLIFETARQRLVTVTLDQNKAGLTGIPQKERVAPFRSPLLDRLEDAIGISTMRPFPFCSRREKQEFKEGFRRKLDGRFIRIDETFRSVMAKGTEQERKAAICMLAHDFAVHDHNNTWSMALANLHLNGLLERKQLRAHVKNLGALLHEHGVERARRFCVSLGRTGDMIMKPVFASICVMTPISFAAVGTDGFTKPLDAVGAVLIGALTLMMASIGKMIIYGHGAKPKPLKNRQNIPVSRPTHTHCPGCTGNCACHDQH